MNDQLPYYIHCFEKLKRDFKNGGAPHKPILLLSIIRLFEKGKFVDNQVSILPELVAAFKSIWNTLVQTNHHPMFVMPFYHMNSEPFWRLVANVGCEKWIESKSSMRSFNNLNTAVSFAQIDTQLADLLTNEYSRDILKSTLLNRYFPETKFFYEGKWTEDLVNTSPIYEPSIEYKRKLSILRNQVDENTFQQEIFIRGGLFKREVPKIYNNTCAISGLRIDALTNISMVDACHIVPFSEGYDDTITNGIALCPNLHRAFDRGLLSISDNYEVIVNRNFIENISVYNLKQFSGIKISLPDKPSLYPALENFYEHRKRFNLLNT